MLSRAPCSAHRMQNMTLRNTSADQLTPETYSKHRRDGRWTVIIKRIRDRELVRSSTLNLFHFGDGAPDGRPAEQTHLAKSSGYPERFGVMRLLCVRPSAVRREVTELRPI